jgi:hypothetical protein
MELRFRFFRLRFMGDEETVVEIGVLGVRVRDLKKRG